MFGKQVATEYVRLKDEAALRQQTDETGDLFRWLTHQAGQGVLSAQVIAVVRVDVEGTSFDHHPSS